MDNKHNGEFSKSIEILKNNPQDADRWDETSGLPGTAQYFIEYY